MARDVYTGRNYNKDRVNMATDQLSAAATRNGSADSVRLSLSTISKSMDVSLKRAELVALRNMLNDILEDWD